jgi:NitT/TauT family transport system substrate-binding protein
MPIPRRALLGALALLPLTLALGACGDDDDSGGSATTSDGASETTAADEAEDVTLRLGFFPNVTHAPALYGIGEGVFEEALPDNVTLSPQPYNAGPEVIEALFADGVDISYIGPNPAINGYAQSDGEALRIIAGATSGGAFFIAREGIDDIADLTGADIATPQLGNTQDVALRSWLLEQGIETDATGGGDVHIVPQANADTLTQFQSGDIDGAWVPEPWATRLLLEGGGHVFLDESDLWTETDGEFVTTHIIVRTAFLEDHPDVVEAFLRGHLAALAGLEADGAAAQTVVNDQIEEVTANRLADATIAGAFQNLRFTFDPIAASLAESAADAEAVGLLEAVDLDGIYALEILNAILAEEGEEEVRGL